MIRKLKLSHIAAMSIATFAATGVVSAAPGYRGQGQRHLKPVQTRLAQNFDYNRDGYLNRRELRAFRQYKQSRQYRLYNRFDVNQDARLDRYERQRMQRWQRVQRRNRRGVVRTPRRVTPRYTTPYTAPRYRTTNNRRNGKRYQGKRFGAQYPNHRVAPTKNRVRDHRTRAERPAKRRDRNTNTPARRGNRGRL